MKNRNFQSIIRPPIVSNSIKKPHLLLITNLFNDLLNITGEEEQLQEIIMEFCETFSISLILVHNNTYCHFHDEKKIKVIYMSKAQENINTQYYADKVLPKSQ